MADALDDVCDATLRPELSLLLLGMMEDVVSRHVNLFLFYALFYGKWEILLLETKTLNTWSTAINTVLPLCKMTYESRNFTKIFDKIWSAWIDAQGSDSI